MSDKFIRRKQCTTCKERLPASNDYFSCNKHRKDGLEGRCKRCRARYYQNHRDYFLEYQRNYHQVHRASKRQRVGKGDHDGPYASHSA